tara:strand:+ start:1320 stop:1790 length:471 start_codon:yes stop_codon:yes gene_type:complete
MQGIKHLIQCHCVLPQFRKRADPFFHKIEVFSTINEDDSVNEKFIVCENCGVVHKVYDLCRSEIQTNHESITSVRTIPEIKLSIDENIANILEKNNCHVSTWENIEFIVDNNISGIPVVISRENIKGKTSIKYIELKDNGKFKIKSEIIGDEVTLG